MNHASQPATSTSSVVSSAQAQSARSRPQQRWTPALRFVLAIAQIVSVIGVSTINLTQPKFAPLVGDALGPWARTAAETLDAFIGAPKQAAAAVTCTFDAPVANPSFTGSAAGWTLGGAWIYNNGQVVNSGDAANNGALSQNVTQVAPSSRVRFTIAWGNSGAANQVALLTISYGGVTYATMLTGGTGGGSFAAQNGATITSSTGTFPFNTNVNMTLVLPAGIPATGALSFAMSRSGATVGVLDDYFIASIDVDTTRVCVRKQTVNGTGTFNFASSNLDNNQVTAGTQSTAAITTLSSGVFEAADANTGVAGSQGGFVLNEAASVIITETLVPNWAVSGTCYDATTSAVVANIAASGVVTLPAASVVIGGSYICDYTNTFPPAVLTATKTAFPSLVQPGDLVSFAPPAGYTFTVQTATAVTATDSNPNPITGVSAPVVLVPDEFNPTIDAGLWRPAALGNYVWSDVNRDGVQNEPASNGINGVTVNLLNASGAVISTQVTHNDPNGQPGYYTFTNLLPGDYAVQVVLPAGYVFTTQDQGGGAGADAQDSDVNPATGRTITTTLAAGEQDPTWDVGLVPLAGLGNYVWSDLNQNGVQDTNEPAVPGVLVTLYDAAGAPVSSTVTAADGSYAFVDLIPGTYSVGFTVLGGYTFTAQQTGGNPASDVDSNPNSTTGRTPSVTLQPGEFNPTIDAGLVPLAGLGNYVWNDLNQNGVQDAGEPGVPGVIVTLQTPGGISTTVTNASGFYSFTNLMPGVPHTVSFTLPPGYRFTVPGANPGSDADSNANPVTGVSAPVVLVPGEFNPTIDAGLVQPVGLGDRVWYDTNHDGVQDAGEPGVPGMTVTLQTPTTTLTTLTNVSGFYSFTNLLPSVPYTVSFTAPDGYTFTVPNATTATLDSNVTTPSGGTPPVVLGSGEYNPTIDAGLWQLPPTLVLTKSAQMMRNVIRSGELVTYTLVARNDGPGIAYNVVISDPLPSGLEYIPGSAVPVAQVNGQTLVWTRPTLGVGERFTLTLVARVQPSAQVTGARIVNVGYALAYAPDNSLVDVPATPLVDDAQAGIIFEPTAVVLTVFRSTWVSGGAGVHVEWQTGSEINTLGFGLYRSTDGTRASAVLVTPELIRSGSINNGGASYSFDDLTAAPGQTYTYWLQEIETSGAVYEYGPVDTDGREIFRPRESRLFLPTLMR